MEHSWTVCQAKPHKYIQLFSRQNFIVGQFVEWKHDGEYPIMEYNEICQTIMLTV